jgi:rhodanese-related sulfurtransferase
VIVDIRDPREIERDGRIPGAFSCTRGMLEFWIDPAKPLCQADLPAGQEIHLPLRRRLRSALAAKTAQDMGLKPVAHMGGGFAAWRDAGGPVEKWEPKKKGYARQHPSSCRACAGHPRLFEPRRRRGWPGQPGHDDLGKGMTGMT